MKLFFPAVILLAALFIPMFSFVQDATMDKFANFMHIVQSANATSGNAATTLDKLLNANPSHDDVYKTLERF